MKVGFITTPLASGHAVRGVGFYTKRLLETLQNLTKTPPNSDIEIIPMTNVHRPSSTVHRPSSIVHYPFFDLFSPTLKMIDQIPTVVTIHDVTPLRFPEHYPPGVRGSLNFLRQKQSLSLAAAIITDSKTSKSDIIHYLNVPENKITVIPLAPQFVETEVSKSTLRNIQKKYHLPPKFVLYVGDINWNKNILSLIRACRKINTPAVLVGKQAIEIDTLQPEKASPLRPKDLLRKLSGRPHPELIHLRDLKSLFKSDLVLRLGFVPEEDLPGIYALASVYCQPSFWEGFGLDPLEALAAGCPVVSSDTPALKELLQDCALYVDPQSVDDIAAGLAKALKSRPVEMVAKGKQRASEFSWEKTATQTLEIYRQIT
jgi:glycosyltransferase involved in cell wall biosynthesis